MIIGVTGVIGSGKSTFAWMLSREIAAPVIDVDVLGHRALTLCRTDIIQEFGKKICSGRNINRKKLGVAVFSDPSKLKRLERIVHPVMYSLVDTRIKNKKNAIIDAAVLFRMKLHTLCDFVIYVDSPKKSLLARLKRRSRMDRRAVEAVLARQKDIKLGKTASDIIVKNTQGTGLLSRRARLLARMLLCLKPNTTDRRANRMRDLKNIS
ncbi:MAG: dephospho-CoA kinase [Spirochaetes bacterium]|nr:dephospho-CoA kinase [Spirochaetota bacterium]